MGGGGLAQASARLGSEVTLIEAAERIPHQEDAEVSGVLFGQFAADGIRTLTGVSARTAAPGANGGAGVHIGLADTLLLAADRRV